MSFNEYLKEQSGFQRAKSFLGGKWDSIKRAFKEAEKTLIKYAVQNELEKQGIEWDEERFEKIHNELSMSIDELIRSKLDEIK